MSSELVVLMVTAASVGLIHTLIGPDHYLPFIVMAKARKWSPLRTGWITLLCGLGHVGGSVVLGVVLAGTFVTNLLPTRRLERYSHALAGAAVFLCGVAIHLGL